MLGVRSGNLGAGVLNASGWSGDRRGRTPWTWPYRCSAPLKLDTEDAGRHGLGRGRRRPTHSEAGERGGRVSRHRSSVASPCNVVLRLLHRLGTLLVQLPLYSWIDWNESVSKPRPNDQGNWLVYKLLKRYVYTVFEMNIRDSKLSM